MTLLPRAHDPSVTMRKTSDTLTFYKTPKQNSSELSKSLKKRTEELPQLRSAEGTVTMHHGSG